ncbi:DUF7684 family protein [Undibacterium squillarum]|uniref:DUF7684 domain-containing protein n=1 Tax=Undibacterium squillarum TaxID=1131567 RepID=A0ABQ2XPQ8_9BURK|nr:hypothetical protein [Undibacterium squillarum]GGX27390.1 hypothetical protein GCM10010946_00020 [Undibacterium squillarum]
MKTTYLHMHPGSLTDRMFMIQNSYTHVLVIALTSVSDHSRYEFCRKLISDHLRYLMCWGAFAKAWEDSANDVICDSPESGSTSVVTTCPPDEMLEEVCWFAKYAALTASDEPRSLLILEISEVSEYAGVAEIVSADRSTVFDA